MRVRAAISPDADDLFMFRAIIEGLVSTGDLEFDVTTADTDALNRMASGDGADVNAISIAHYPRVATHYRLFRHGASVGRGYGPVVVQRQGDERPLRGARVAVPGLTTTAYLVLRLLLPEFEPVVVPIVPYRRTFDALASGEVSAALLIHEGRLSFVDEGCVARIDLGEAWLARTGLPLPLGGNVVRRALGDEVVGRVSAVIKASIVHAMEHREEAMDWLVARGVSLSTRERLSQYLHMYANADTVDMGDDGEAGVRRVLEEGHRLGFFPPTTVDFAV